MREKLRIGLLLSAILTAFFALSIGYRYLHEQWIIDDCLSGKHGSFNYSTMSCDLRESHPYVSYNVRHSRDPLMAEIAFVSFAAFMWGYKLMKTSGEKA